MTAQQDAPRGNKPPGALAAVEAHSIDFIQDSERHGSVWKQGPFWFVANFNFFSIALGFVGPSLGLSVGWTVIAGAAGLIFGTFFMAFHASQGPKLGLPQMVQSRAQFGYRGVIVPTIAVFISFMVFNVLETNVIQSGLHGIFGWNPTAVAIIVGVLAAVLAIYGHDWLHLVFRFLFWISLPFYAILSIAIMTGNVAGHGNPRTHLSAAAFMAVFAVSASYNISLAPDVSDYTRYLPRTTKTRIVVFTVLVGAVASALWLMAMGAWFAIRAGATDGLVALNSSGNQLFSHFGTAIALLSVVGLIAVIGINTYCAVMEVVTVADCFRAVRPTRGLRIGICLVLLVIWVVITINLGSNQATLINNLLSVLLYLLVPWTAVNLIDFFFVRKGHYAITEIFDPGGIYGVWAWRGLTAYFVGLAAQIPFMVLSFYKGPVAQHINNIDISFVVGLVVSAGLYLILARTLDLTAEQAVNKRSDELLAKGINPELPEIRPQLAE
jgi:purine-cytosine permease-like protein